MALGNPAELQTVHEQPRIEDVISVWVQLNQVINQPVPGGVGAIGTEETTLQTLLKKRYSNLFYPTMRSKALALVMELARKKEKEGLNDQQVVGNLMEFLGIKDPVVGQYMLISFANLIIGYIEDGTQNLAPDQIKIGGVLALWFKDYHEVGEIKDINLPEVLAYAQDIQAKVTADPNSIDLFGIPVGVINSARIDQNDHDLNELIHAYTRRYSELEIATNFYDARVGTHRQSKEDESRFRLLKGALDAVKERFKLILSQKLIDWGNGLGNLPAGLDLVLLLNDETEFADFATTPTNTPPVVYISNKLPQKLRELLMDFEGPKRWVVETGNMVKDDSNLLLGLTHRPDTRADKDRREECEQIVNRRPVDVDKLLKNVEEINNFGVIVDEVEEDLENLKAEHVEVEDIILWYIGQDEPGLAMIYGDLKRIATQLQAEIAFYEDTLDHLVGLDDWLEDINDAFGEDQRQEQIDHFHDSYEVLLRYCDGYNDATLVRLIPDLQDRLINSVDPRGADTLRRKCLGVVLELSYAVPGFPELDKLDVVKLEQVLKQYFFYPVDNPTREDYKAVVAFLVQEVFRGQHTPAGAENKISQYQEMLLRSLKAQGANEIDDDIETSLSGMDIQSIEVRGLSKLPEATNKRINNPKRRQELQDSRADDVLVAVEYYRNVAREPYQDPKQWLSLDSTVDYDFTAKEGVRTLKYAYNDQLELLQGIRSQVVNDEILIDITEQEVARWELVLRESMYVVLVDAWHEQLGEYAAYIVQIGNPSYDEVWAENYLNRFLSYAEEGKLLPPEEISAEELKTIYEMFVAGPQVYRSAPQGAPEFWEVILDFMPNLKSGIALSYANDLERLIEVDDKVKDMVEPWIAEANEINHYAKQIEKFAQTVPLDLLLLEEAKEIYFDLQTNFLNHVDADTQKELSSLRVDLLRLQQKLTLAIKYLSLDEADYQAYQNYLNSLEGQINAVNMLLEKLLFTENVINPINKAAAETNEKQTADFKRNYENLVAIRGTEELKIDDALRDRVLNVLNTIGASKITTKGAAVYFILSEMHENADTGPEILPFIKSFFGITTTEEAWAVIQILIDYLHSDKFVVSSQGARLLGAIGAGSVLVSDSLYTIPREVITGPGDDFIPEIKNIGGVDSSPVELEENVFLESELGNIISEYVDYSDEWQDLGFDKIPDLTLLEAVSSIDDTQPIPTVTDLFASLDPANRPKAAPTTNVPTPEAIPAVHVPEVLTPGRIKTVEDQTRALKQDFQAGLITRDELQAELRGLMLLDENRVWWMVGVETDQWYRFENGDWVIATPAQEEETAGSSLPLPEPPPPPDIKPSGDEASIEQEGNKSEKVRQAEAEIFDNAGKRKIEEVEVMLQNAYLRIEQLRQSRSFGKIHERIDQMMDVQEVIYDHGVAFIPQEQGALITIGDIHGDAATIKQIITETRFLENQLEGQGDMTLVFMGDLFDRGDKQPQVLEIILALQNMFGPEKVICMRADHDEVFTGGSVVTEHDFPTMLTRHYFVLENKKFPPEDFDRIHEAYIAEVESGSWFKNNVEVAIPKGVVARRYKTFVNGLMRKWFTEVGYDENQLGDEYKKGYEEIKKQYEAVGGGAGDLYYMYQLLVLNLANVIADTNLDPEFSEKRKKLTESINKLTYDFPRAVACANGVLLSHGGVPPTANGLYELAIDDYELEASVWADPATEKEIEAQRKNRGLYEALLQEFEEENDRLFDIASYDENVEVTVLSEKMLVTRRGIDLFIQNMSMVLDSDFAIIPNPTRISRNGNLTASDIYRTMRKGFIKYSQTALDNFLAATGASVMVRGHQISSHIKDVALRNWVSIHSSGKGSPDSYYARGMSLEQNPTFGIFDKSQHITEIQPQNIIPVWTNTDRDYINSFHLEVEPVVPVSPKPVEVKAESPVVEPAQSLVVEHGPDYQEMQQVKEQLEFALIYVRADITGGHWYQLEDPNKSVDLESKDNLIDRQKSSAITQLIELEKEKIPEYENYKGFEHSYVIGIPLSSRDIEWFTNSMQELEHSDKPRYLVKMAIRGLSVGGKDTRGVHDEIYIVISEPQWVDLKGRIQIVSNQAYRNFDDLVRLVIGEQNFHPNPQDNELMYSPTTELKVVDVGGGEEAAEEVPEEPDIPPTAPSAPSSPKPIEQLTGAKFRVEGYKKGNDDLAEFFRDRSADIVVNEEDEITYTPPDDFIYSFKTPEREYNDVKEVSVDRQGNITFKLKKIKPMKVLDLEVENVGEVTISPPPEERLIKVQPSPEQPRYSLTGQLMVKVNRGSIQFNEINVDHDSLNFGNGSVAIILDQIGINGVSRFTAGEYYHNTFKLTLRDTIKHEGRDYTKIIIDPGGVTLVYLKPDGAEVEEILPNEVQESAHVRVTRERAQQLGIPFEYLDPRTILEDWNEYQADNSIRRVSGTVLNGEWIKQHITELAGKLVPNHDYVLGNRFWWLMADALVNRVKYNLTPAEQSEVMKILMQVKPKDRNEISLGASRVYELIDDIIAGAVKQFADMFGDEVNSGSLFGNFLGIRKQLDISKIKEIGDESWFKVLQEFTAIQKDTVRDKLLERKYAYAILKIQQGSTETEIKSAYRKLARIWHPDVNNQPKATDIFAGLSAAYEYLTDAKYK